MKIKRKQNSKFFTILLIIVLIISNMSIMPAFAGEQSASEIGFSVLNESGTAQDVKCAGSVEGGSFYYVDMKGYQATLSVKQELWNTVCDITDIDSDDDIGNVNISIDQAEEQITVNYPGNPTKTKGIVQDQSLGLLDAYNELLGENGFSVDDYAAYSIFWIMKGEEEAAILLVRWEDANFSVSDAGGNNIAVNYAGSVDELGTFFYADISADKIKINSSKSDGKYYDATIGDAPKQLVFPVSMTFANDGKTPTTAANDIQAFQELYGSLGINYAVDDYDAYTAIASDDDGCFLLLRWKYAGTSDNCKVNRVEIDKGISCTPVQKGMEKYHFVMDKGVTSDKATIKVAVPESVTSVKYGTDAENLSAKGVEALKDDSGNYQIIVDLKQGFVIPQYLQAEEKTVYALITAGEESSVVQFIIHKRVDIALPDSVEDYLCVGSQYTSGGNQGWGIYGWYPEKTLLGNISATDWPNSLGNFGGYIVYKFEDGITDNPKNPYGIDFTVFGSGYIGEGFSEPGAVMVSEDGNTWYELAGSVFYDDTTKWNQEVTYTYGATETKYSFKDGENGTFAFQYSDVVGASLIDNYPLAAAKNAINAENNSATLKGTLITEMYPAFGYADVRAGGWKTAVKASPYTGNYEHTGDCFDLKWAVDPETGKPVDLSKKTIHYVKVYTANFTEGKGATGEKSTEVNSVVKATASEAAVGTTAAPTAITIDGHSVALQEGKYEYDVAVSGLFDVKVAGAEDKNVYINSIRGTSADFTGLEHGIVRIIIQEDEKEPLIYYFNITDGGESEAAPVTTVTLNCKGGNIEGQSTATKLYDKNTADKTLSVPVREGYKFDGWFNGQIRYTDYTEDMGEAITLTAQWTADGTAPSEPAENTIQVSFRLIGATQSKTDVDLSTNECDSKYVNWIKTKNYTLPENSTVYDLFVKAVSDAGLRQIGAENGYVSTIYAPSVLGGYELSEFTNGKYSGWMYTMNGNHTDGIKVQKLSDRANVIFHYVNDYRYEVADGATLDFPVLGDGTWHNGWLKAEDVSPGTGMTPSVEESDSDDSKVTTSDGAEKVTTSPTEVDVKGDTATATVTDDNAAELVKQAGEKKSDEIVIKVEASATGKASEIKAELSASTVQDIVDKTEAVLTVKTAEGEVTMDRTSLAGIAKSSINKGAKKVSITVAKRTVSDEEKTKYGKDLFSIEVILSFDGGIQRRTSGTVTAADDMTAELGGGNVTIKVPLGADAPDKLYAARENADGSLIGINGEIKKKEGKAYYEFTTKTLGRFLFAKEQLADKTEGEEATDKHEQEITVSKDKITKRYGAKAFNLGAKANTELSYKSSNTKVVTVTSSGKVRIKGAGSAKITIRAAESDTYKAAEKTVTIKVNKAKQTVKIKKNVRSIKRAAVAKKARTYTFTTTGKKTALKAVKLTKAQKKAIKSVKISGNKVKVTVKKGAKKGTYKLKVYAAQGKNYKASAKKVITIRVK